MITVGVFERDRENGYRQSQQNVETYFTYNNPAEERQSYMYFHFVL